MSKGSDLFAQAFSLSALLKVDITHSLIGGAIVLVIGAVLQAALSFQIPFIGWTVWKIVSYVNPLCLIHGFSKCDSAANKALAVVLAAYLVVIVLYVAAVASSPEFAMQIFNMFPPLPFLIGMAVGLGSWYMLKTYGTKWSATSRIVGNRMAFPMVCLGLSVVTLPLVLLLVKLIKRHSSHPAHKYGGDLERMTAHQNEQLAELAAAHHNEHAQMLAHNFQSGTLPSTHYQHLQQAHATGGSNGLARAIGGLANSSVGSQLSGIAQSIANNPALMEAALSALV